MKKLMMNSLKSVLLAVWFLTTVGAMANEEYTMQGDGKSDKIDALRIAFISQRLNLTPEEAQKFWPVYNQYTADIKKLRENFGMGAGKPQLTAEQSLDFEQKKLDLKKKYKTQFENAIGKDKVNILYSVEEEFRQQLRQMREAREHDKRH